MISEDEAAVRESLADLVGSDPDLELVASRIARDARARGDDGRPRRIDTTPGLGATVETWLPDVAQAISRPA